MPARGCGSGSLSSARRSRPSPRSRTAPVRTHSTTQPLRPLAGRWIEQQHPSRCPPGRRIATAMQQSRESGNWPRAPGRAERRCGRAAVRRKRCSTITAPVSALRLRRQPRASLTRCGLPVCHRGKRPVDCGPVEEHDRLAVTDLAIPDHRERLEVGQLEDLDVLALIGGAAPGIGASRERVRARRRSASTR